MKSEAGSPSSLEHLRDRYLAAQLSGNRREALRLVIEEGVSRGASVQEVAVQIIEAAQRQIGVLWEKNRISIAQEHMATAISQLAMAHLFQFATPERTTGFKILVACVEGELHDFPARLAADALELAGFDIRFLGANVPTDSLLQIVESERPALLALSVTMTFHLPQLKQAVARVKAAFPSLPVIVGGHACSWQSSIAAQVGAVASGCSSRELVATVQKLLGVKG